MGNPLALRFDVILLSVCLFLKTRVGGERMKETETETEIETETDTEKEIEKQRLSNQSYVEGVIKILHIFTF